MTVLKVNKSVYRPLHWYQRQHSYIRSFDFLLYTLLKYINDQLKIIVEDDREWRENWMDVQYIILLLSAL